MAEQTQILSDGELVRLVGRFLMLRNQYNSEQSKLIVAQAAFDRVKKELTLVERSLGTHTHATAHSEVVLCDGVAVFIPQAPMGYQDHRVDPIILKPKQ